MRIHPRMRGDQPTMIAGRCQEKLFTPHARGSIQVNDRFIESTSIYPADAGINLHKWLLGLKKIHLPRMRGDQPMQILGDGFVLKFTPQARGSTQFDMPPARRASIYPACAGINPHLGQIVLICLHLPRVCGDQPRVTVMVASFSAFTPRARGSTMMRSQLKQRECQRLHKNSIGDIIPIYAE